MEIIEIQQQIEKAIEWFGKNYKELALAEAEYKHQDDMKKTQLAIAEIEEKGSTQAETLRNGLASKKYIDFLFKLDIVRAKYLEKKAEYAYKDAAFQGLRSLNKNIQ